MKKFFALFALMMVSSLPFLAREVAAAPLSGSVGAGIIAVVNDNAITSIDLEHRMRLAMLSSGFPNTPEVRQHLLPQILRTLVDEQLQVQEANRLGLTVSDDELGQTLARIARDNNIQGGMLAFMAKNGVSPETLENQVRTGMLWRKVVQRELRPKIDIGDDEINAVIERMRADAGKEEFLVSEILLTVDNPADEDQVRRTAQNLVTQIKNGANFSAVANQFSQDASAVQGGDIGWIKQGQLLPELNRALAASQPGQISDPIRTSKGFHILGVRNKRTLSFGDPQKASVSLSQAFRPYVEGNKQAVLREASDVRLAAKSCASLEDDLDEFSEWKLQSLGTMILSKAPSWIVDKVRTVSVGGSSEPLDTDKGAVVLFVCGRDDGSGVDREAIVASIGTEKLELQARRLLRDLRRAAYLDIRVGR